MSTYIIPDIHGCIKTLRSLVEDRLNITASDTIYFLGDFIDRGPDSAGVIDYILGLKDVGVGIEGLLGNHEHMMLNSFMSKSDLNLWMINSGLSTLKSYGIKSKYRLNIYESIPPKHLFFFQSLKSHLIVDEKFILVHGGINYHAVNPFADTDAMLWNRPAQVPSDFMPGYTIIHGHTPTPIDFIIRDVMLRENRLIGIDTGCVYKGQLPGTGYLTALNIDKWKLDFVECID